MLLVLLLVVYVLLTRSRRKQRNCWHHGRTPSQNPGQPQLWIARSYITSQLIDSGSRKMFECTKCGKMWFT